MEDGTIGGGKASQMPGGAKRINLHRSHRENWLSEPRRISTIEASQGLEAFQNALVADSESAGCHVIS